MNLMREEGWGLSNRPSVFPLNVYKSLGLNLIDAQCQSTEFSLLSTDGSPPCRASQLRVPMASGDSFVLTTCGWGQGCYCV